MSALGPEWACRYPDRWHEEQQALAAAGCPVRVLERDQTVVVELDWPCHAVYPAGTETHGGLGPCSAGDTVRLEVRFPAEYPFFPPHVYDHDNQLNLLRHRNTRGALCLIEDADWHPATTIAALLTEQLPRLLVAGRSADPPEDGLEVAAPEPIDCLLRYPEGGDALIMPSAEIPEGMDEGVVVVRYTIRRPDILGAGLVERILGQDLDIPGPAPALERIFNLVTFGRWARDPDFDPTDTAEQTWQRVEKRLLPLHAVLTGRTGSDEGGGAPWGAIEVQPAEIETLCLLVPSERTYRQAGETWLALLRGCRDDGTVDYHQIPVQRLGPEVYAVRTPESELLAHRHVVLVGLGAVGGHLALDLARSGVGRLDLVDGDDVDVATAMRQYAPLFAAGRPKAEAILSHLRVVRPDIHLVGLDLRIGIAADHDMIRKKRATFARMLRTADLVIDATAAPAVTRYLAAVRQLHRKPFLHVSATAGAWGGCVFLTTPETGCWSCLQLHRHDQTVPVPTADPAGLFTPAGCAQPTFTGTSAELATIASHAARVAAEYLGQPNDSDVNEPGRPAGRGASNELGGSYHVAHLRTPAGAAQPVRWETAPIPPHPSCPLHTRFEEVEPV